MRDRLGEGFDPGAVDEAAIRKSLKALARSPVSAQGELLRQASRLICLRP
jgi:hypothetical protein